MVDLRQEIEIIRGQVKVSLNLMQAVETANKQLLTSLESLLKDGLKQGSTTLPVSTIPVNEHRKQHRFGPAAKIDADPQLQAFLQSRVERMTYLQMQHEVAANFPPDRRVSRSSIQRWWQRETKAKQQTKP